MKFKPADRVIDLLVGEDLYSTPDAAIRELLQNAEDACWLYSQTGRGTEFMPRITVRYSQAGNWVEVEDNGLGMDEQTLESSFVAIGASKNAVPHIAAILSTSSEDRQIAKFGIGILSCFGVASTIELWTKMDDILGLAFRVPDYRAEFEELEEVPEARGTRVRLYLKDETRALAVDAPAAVAKHARHAEHVTLQNADTGEYGSIPSSWAGEEAAGAMELRDKDILKGVLALNPDWGRNHHVAPRLVVCNGGFLVSESITDLLPSEATGYIGEVDLRPGALRILMNREQFKRDQAWDALQERLTAHYNELLSGFVSLVRQDAAADDAEIDIYARRVLVLLKGPSQSILSPEVKRQLEALVPDILLVSASGESSKRALRKYIDRCKAAGTVLYYYRAERERQSVQGRIDTDDATIQITETIEMSLRVSLLRAQGATVVPCKLRRFHETLGTGNINVDIHEADLLTQYAAAVGVTTRAVDEATFEELELHFAPQSQLLGTVLNIGSDLKVAHLPASKERVIRDFTGRILNAAHEEVRRVMQTLPEAAGNPIRRALIQIYMDLANHQVAEARERVLDLLTREDLEEQAGLRGGALQREYLRGKVSTMIGESVEA